MRFRDHLPPNESDAGEIILGLLTELRQVRRAYLHQRRVLQRIANDYYQDRHAQEAQRALRGLDDDGKPITSP